MKKALVLTSLASLAAISFGCVLTDYPQLPVQNKSHGLIGCATNDRVANAQQTVEGDTRELLYTTSFHTACDSFNAPIIDPLANVSSQDARDWNRFNANYAFILELIDTSGTYILGGVKDLADGSTRINTFWTNNGGSSFSCVGDAVDGRYGGPEGVVMADRFGRLPGLRVEAVAIDSSTANGFCTNLAALHPDRAVNPFSTYLAQTARAGEAGLAATPITRRANLANLLNNGVESITLQGVTATGRGQLNADGSWTVELLSLSNDSASYQAETPVKLTASPANDFRTWKVENANESELVRLAQFAIDGGLTDREISLAGIQLPEFGYTFGDMSMVLSSGALQGYIDRNSAPVDGN